jgi:hypothetical protein
MIREHGAEIADAKTIRQGQQAAPDGEQAAL